MNGLSKGILLRVVLPVVVGSALALRLALKSDLARRRIQESLSNALQMEVRFEKLSPTFFKGSRVSGLSASRPGGSSFTAREVYVKPRLMSLLRGQFELSDVRIEEVRLVLVESAEVQVERSKGGAGSALLSRGPSRLMARHVEVENASVDWIDSRGKIVLRVQGAQLSLHNRGGAEAEGRMRVRGGILKELLPFRGLESSIRVNGSRYQLPDLKAECGGGRLRGELETEPWHPQLPVSMKLKADGLDLAKMSVEAPALQASGQFEGNWQMEGRWKDPASWVGGGELLLREALFQGFNVLQSIGNTFQISELSQFRFEKAQAKVGIGEQRCSFEKLVAEGGGIGLSAEGSVDFERRLDLKVKLDMPETMLRGKLISRFQDRFSAVDAAGRRAIEFELGGTTDKPRMNLFEKLVGEGIGQMLDKVIGGFLKSKKGETPAPKKEGEAPAPSR